ncbi:YbdD/YjiX family protein [Acinetobacter sp. ANC 4178]|uniref:YbdD/YjiX family protein n=1 Tax=Acinetobacter sp. ANC 4178 TaxID=2529839 RepID=UPI00103EE4FD|nr:YbdD/YjiX family protein [Acinetobacter sp. ANC 4178]TCB68698.1 YbdD/YjiX family protein [Acinetobacter sp. ANC 4178]
MNLRFAKGGKTVIYKIIKMTIMSQKDLIFSPKNWSRIATLWQGLQQSFRLMVGVPDYENYVEHMKKHHPDLAPMDAKTFYRHCVDARYPTAGGNLKKCPC